MFSYHDIQVVFLGKKYPARLFGDRIEIKELDITLKRKDITAFKIRPFSNYKISTNNPTLSHFEVAPLNAFALWLDSFYFARLAMLTAIFTISFGGSLYILGLSSWWAVVLYSFLNTYLAFVFSRWVKLPVGKVVLYSSLTFTFVGLANFFVFPFALVLYLLFAINLFICLAVYSWLKTTRVIKVYVIIAWLLFTFCTYNFMLFTASTINANWARSINDGPVISEVETKKFLRMGSFDFKVPFIWRTKIPGFAFGVRNLRNLLFDLSPFNSKYVFSYEGERKHVALASSKFAVQATNALIGKFVSGQSIYLYALYIARTEALPIDVPNLHSQGVLQGHIMFDLNSLKRVTLFTFTAPIYKERFVDGSVVFSFLLDEEVSAERITQIIIDGFQNGRLAKDGPMPLKK